MPGVRWRIQYLVDPASRQKIIRDAQNVAQRSQERFTEGGKKAATSWLAAFRAMFKKVEGDAQHSATKSGGFFSTMFGQLTAFFGLYRVMAFGREVVKLGMDSAETASKFTTTFGAAADSAQAFIDKWSTIAGLSTDEAKDFLATTASIIQGLGGTQQAAADLSIQVAKMAGDFTSFSNVPIERTSQAITRALTGEYEALKTLGIAINMDMVTAKAQRDSNKASVKELTKLEIALATASLIQGQMKVQTGDLEKTQLSLANTSRFVGASWKNLKTEIGKMITETEEVPQLFATVGVALKGMMDWLIANKTEVKSWAGTIIQFTAWAVKGLASGVGSIVKLFYNGGQVIGNMLELSYNGFKLFIEDVLNDIFSAMNEVGKVSNELFKTTFGHIELYKTGETRAEIDRLTTDVTQNLLDMNDAIVGGARAFDELAFSGARARKATKGISGVGGEDKGVDGKRPLTPEQQEKLNKELAERATKLRILQTNFDIKMKSIGDIGGAGMLSILGPKAQAALRGPKLVTGEGAIKSDGKDSPEIARLERIGEVAKEVSNTIEQTFGKMFENMEGNWGDLGRIATSSLRAIGAAAIGSIASLASKKVGENVAAGLEAGARALGFLSLGNFASSSAAWASAAQHGAAALAWGALAGGASVGAGAIAGTGGGRGGASGIGGAVGAASGGRGPDVHVYLDGVDPRNPRHQALIGKTNEQYGSRGGGKIVYHAGKGAA